MNQENLQSFEGNKLSNLYQTSSGGGVSDGGGGGGGGGHPSHSYSSNNLATGFIQSWIDWAIGMVQDMRRLKQEVSNSTWSEIFMRCRNSRQLVLLVVFIALFFDNMLLTTVGK